MKGHAEHDDAGYVPKELFEEWRRKDPIERFERHLLANGLAEQAGLDALAAQLNAQLDADVDFALASPFPPPERALDGVYAESETAPEGAK
jgi:TPP-dependent pyruvate/acetoin dehydrogenase alpha subunit